MSFEDENLFSVELAATFIEDQNKSIKQLIIWFSIFLIVMSIILTFALMLIDNTPQIPCEEYEDRVLRDLPVRCIEYYFEGVDVR